MVLVVCEEEFLLPSTEVLFLDAVCVAPPEFVDEPLLLPFDFFVLEPGSVLLAVEPTLLSEAVVLVSFAFCSALSLAYFAAL